MFQFLKWFVLSIASYLGIFFLIYAIYCEVMEVEPQNLYMLFQTALKTSSEMGLTIPRIPQIPLLVVGDSGMWLDALTGFANLFFNLVNVLSGLINFLTGIINGLVSILNFLLTMVSIIFGEIVIPVM